MEKVETAEQLLRIAWRDDARAHGQNHASDLRCPHGLPDTVRMKNSVTSARRTAPAPAPPLPLLDLRAALIPPGDGYRVLPARHLPTEFALACWIWERSRDRPHDMPPVQSVASGG